MAEKFLAIKSYWTHQHYHKRGAPWIKLYASVLADATFVQMPEAAQAQLMKLWVLASQFGHPLPNKPKLLAGKIGTTGKFHLATLIDAGFIIPCDENASKDASNSLAESSSCSTEIEGEREEELEKTLLPRNAGEAEAEAGLAAMLETDADRNALTAVIAKASNRLACIQALRSMLTGNDPALPQPTPSAFGQALRDMSVNNAQPTARKIRNYVLDAVRSQRELSRPPAEAMRSHSAGSHRPTSNGNGRGALMFGEIQKLIRELRQPGQAANRFIPRKEIEALGPDVVAAYDAIGGADRVLAATGKDVGFVLRDFVDALEAAHV